MGSAAPPSAVFDAAFRGDERALRATLSAGADADARDERTGGTPLYAAAFNGHADCVAALLEAGADAARDEGSSIEAHDGLSEGARAAPLPPPLWVAAANGHATCVATLLAAGASSEAANRAGVVPLRAATARGHHDAVRALLDAGATADAVDDKTGVTPLMEACYNDDVPMARLLAAAGADSGRRAANGLCAMEMASERMREALADVDRLRREQAHTQVQVRGQPQLGDDVDAPQQASEQQREPPQEVDAETDGGTSARVQLLLRQQEAAQRSERAGNTQAGGAPVPPPLRVALPETPRDASAAAERSTCVVCLDAPRACAFVPCMHYVVCAQCGDDIMRVAKLCPICRQRATACTTIYES